MPLHSGTQSIITWTKRKIYGINLYISASIHGEIIGFNLQIFGEFLGHKRSLAGPGPKYKILYFEKSI